MKIYQENIKINNFVKIDIVATCSDQLAHEHCNIDGNVAMMGNKTPDLTVDVPN